MASYKILNQGGGLIIRIDIKQLLAKISDKTQFPDVKWISIFSGTEAQTQIFDSAVTSGIIEIKIPREELEEDSLRDGTIDPDGVEIELGIGSSKLSPENTDGYYIYCYYTITNDPNTKYSPFVVKVPNGAWAFALTLN